MSAATGCATRRGPAPTDGPALPLGGFAPVSSVQEGEYRVGIGDTLRIRFLFHNELDSEPEVRRDGHITITGLGDFQAYGISTRELEQDIYRRASLTYRNPQVGVVVTKQSIHRAYIGGEVSKPGYVDLRPGMTALRAIFMSGGFRDTAKVDNVLHVRWADDGSYSAEVVDLKEVLETGDVRGDVMLTANDLVFVPKTPIANANLWVQQYIIDLLPVRQPTTRLDDFGL
jgi:protein involved in polysaccharide export with SLBB domain